MDGARFAGITTFPALLFDPETRKIAPDAEPRDAPRRRRGAGTAGRSDIAINAPGTTSSVVLAALADAGATQIEPGHGLTGTTPLHAVEDLPELPAVVYVSEVSHHHGDRRLLLRRRPLHRSDLPRLSGPGGRGARADGRRRRAPRRSRSRRRRRSTTTA